VVTEPQRITFQPHHNAIFDVQWSRSDELLATAGADQSVGISKLTPSEAKLTRSLRYHTSTVKCVTWDPTRDGDVLCSGSRDGMICIWDLRESSGVGTAGAAKKPVIVVSKAHDTGKSGVRKSKLSQPPARGVTSLVFSSADPYALISGGSYDG
jgi:denticleless